MTRFTPVQHVWIRDNCDNYSNEELHKKYNERWKENRSRRSILAYCYRNKLRARDQNGLPIGTERKRYNNAQNDETRVKVCNSSNEKVAWQLKQNVIWEAFHNRKLPKNHLVVFLDGNKDNFAIENLHAVSRPVHLAMAGIDGYTNFPELTLTNIVICELMQAMKEPLGRKTSFSQIESRFLNRGVFRAKKFKNFIESS